MPSRIYALNIHADYRCRHSGVCCSLDWDVPVELPVYRSLDDAFSSGRLRTGAHAGGLPPFVTDEPPDGAGAVFQRTDAGVCVFLDPASRLCIVHRDLGEDALAATCRFFPRLSLVDGRGTFVTLSHFCPTAASMLFRDDVGPLAVLEGPPAFPLADYDGLTVGADDLPPLLTPRMLMDLDGYDAWERHMIACCATGARPEAIVATLMRDARLLSAWTPGATSLADAVAALPRPFVDAPPHEDLGPSLEAHAGVVRAVPDDLRPEPDWQGLGEAFARWVRPVWSDYRVPLARFIASKAFASWTAYQGPGVATVLEGLDAAVALVRVEAARQCRDAGRPLDQPLMLEAFRAADFLLNHLATGEDLASEWSAAAAVRL